ncbi:MAG: hypothetical protein K2P93_01620 [Alphaproteobacteria bacterium]|nr:hypothetical protein [Alphaproteobacteria bacterium]
MRNLVYIISIFTIVGTFPLKAGLVEEGWEPMAPVHTTKLKKSWENKAAKRPEEYKIIGNTIWKKVNKKPVK